MTKDKKKTKKSSKKTFAKTFPALSKIKVKKVSLEKVLQEAEISRYQYEIRVLNKEVGRARQAAHNAHQTLKAERRRKQLDLQRVYEERSDIELHQSIKITNLESRLLFALKLINRKRKQDGQSPITDRDLTPDGMRRVAEADKRREEYKVKYNRDNQLEVEF